MFDLKVLGCLGDSKNFRSLGWLTFWNFSSYLSKSAYRMTKCSSDVKSTGTLRTKYVLVPSSSSS